MKVFILAAAIFALSVTPVAAERTSVETSKGVETTATVGSVIWQRTEFESVPGVIIDGSVAASWSSAGSTYLPEKSKLIIVRDRPFRACQTQVILNYNLTSDLPAWQNCLTDKDGDGLFELVAFYDGSILKKKIYPPVKYTRAMVPMNGPNTKTTQQSLSFLGKSGSDLRISYREFVNGLARPAFTEELTLPAPTAFPQSMTLKDVKLTLLGLDGSGLRYRID